jgi:hypothetical protein
MVEEEATCSMFCCKGKHETRTLVFEFEVYYHHHYSFRQECRRHAARGNAIGAIGHDVGQFNDVDEPSTVHSVCLLVRLQWSRIPQGQSVTFCYEKQSTQKEACSVTVLACLARSWTEGH